MGPRERLLGRARPTDSCQIRVDDSTKAEAEASAAAAELQMVLLVGGDEQAREQARERVHQAQAALRACFEEIVCTALPPAEFEALADAHPPRPDDLLDEAWNMDTFPRACFLACAPGYFTTAEWETWLDTQVNEGERIRLYNTAINANTRVPDPTLPKDSTPTLS